ncbi:hypothetical protein A1A1_07217 [Planococcus antarcticus DSM 14505]|uniref:Uncharacterized protein n=1 Tax=Planococcus antarcticus DSM 14505 TaxID=1185653 RepID=A0A1C7DG68_9BACL|nr:hypothetical protein [Planococcus antarcticus]ANU10261.1 hypothetical protein BBH88_08075 [Planococcus antarcticus DSM 14505]EIM07168.1 hypothetical protein A1A1_07217 [Planococcus antarcticus DSM 14505]
MSLIIFTAVMFLKNEVELYSENNVSLTVEKPTFITLSEPEVTESGSDLTQVYNMTLLGLDVGTYTLVDRSLQNGTSLIFEEIKNTGWIPYTLSMNVNNLEDSRYKSWNPQPVDKLDETKYGSDLTTNPYGVFTAGNGEILIGNVYVSRNLQLGNGDPVQELRHEIAEFTVEESTLSKNLWLPPKHTSQTWLMASQEPLFETEEVEDEWVAFSLQNRLSQLNWLTPEGPYVKLELTDDPRTQLAYGYIEKRTADLTSLEWNETSPSLFFESMILNAQINQQ